MTDPNPALSAATGVAKSVSDTTYGFHEVGEWPQLLAQRAHVHIDRPFENDRIIAEGRIDQILPREGAAWLPNQCV